MTTVQKLIRENIRHSAFLLGMGEASFHYRWRSAPEKVTSFHPHHDETESLLIHIPKNGGTSLNHALYGIPSLYGHAPASSFQRRDPKKFDAYTKIAVLRDPVERFCSGFWYHKGGNLHEITAAWSKRHLSEIDTPSALIAAMASPWFRSTVLSWVLFVPQVWFLRVPGKGIEVDYIGRTENMEKASRDISELLDRRVDIPNANASARPKREDLSEAEKRQIRNWYAEDQDLVESHPI